MTIYMDRPRKREVPFSFGNYGYKARAFCAHLISDKPGHEGHEELRLFAQAIGSKPEWLRDEGGGKEHYDVIGLQRIGAAVRAGVKQIGNRELAAKIKAKRLAMEAAE